MLYRVGVCSMILYGAAGGRAGGPGSLIGFAGGILSCWGVLGVGCSVLYSTMIAERHDPDSAWAAQAGGRCVLRRREAGRSVAGLRCLEQPRSCTISDWCLCVMHGGGGSCYVVLGV